ncbi:MAG: hypothetical protein ACW99L_16595 [Promethearchaeota archaeon]|jgi:flap endonuclease-1
MGVKLQELIIRKTIDYDVLKGKIVAIDAPNIIMSLFNFTRKDSEGSPAGLLLDRTQRPISHLYGILYRVNFYYSKKIFPIFCFDGKVSELKRIITKDKLNDFRFIQKWYQKAIESKNYKLAKEIALGKEYMWQNIINESKQLLGALGVPYIDSPSSAESECAYLVKKGIAHYSNSQDFDSLLFGCPLLVQNLSKSLRRKEQGKWKYTKISPFVINLQKNLKKLEVNQFQLVDLSLLIGTDYFPGIKGLGPKKSLALIKKYHQIEDILKFESKKFNFNDLTPEIIKKVRKLFLFPDVNISVQEIRWNPPHKSLALELLCIQHHLNKKRVQTHLDKLTLSYQQCRNYFIKLEDKPSTIQLTLDRVLK